MTEAGVLKHGVGYDLIIKQIAVPRTRIEPRRQRLILGIRCHTCGRTSYHPNDVKERYCGACKTFHEDQQGPTQIA